MVKSLGISIDYFLPKMANAIHPAPRRLPPMLPPLEGNDVFSDLLTSTGILIPETERRAASLDQLALMRSHIVRRLKTETWTVSRCCSCLLPFLFLLLYRGVTVCVSGTSCSVPRLCVYACTTSLVTALASLSPSPSLLFSYSRCRHTQVRW